MIPTARAACGLVHRQPCRRHGINPFDYLNDLFSHLPKAKITEIKQFTPAAWVKTKAKERAATRST
jgi:hypothetical protein